jgi:hypothetical protein
MRRNWNGWDGVTEEIMLRMQTKGRVLLQLTQFTVGRLLSSQGVWRLIGPVGSGQFETMHVRFVHH